MEALKAEFLARLLAHAPVVLDDPKTIYRRDATCKWCGAEYGLDPHRDSCAWEQARQALHVLSTPRRV